MTVAAKDSIRTLPLNSEEVMFAELSLTKSALEHLFKFEEAQIPKDQLLNDLSKIVELSDRIQTAATLHQKSDIYYDEYRPFSDELKTKYSEFLPRDIFRAIEVREKYMDGLKKLITFQGLMLLALENETEEELRYGKLYTGAARLSELLEEYLPYFPPTLIEYIRSIASALLSDPTLKPDESSQVEQVFSQLLSLKNAAISVLWKIENYQKEYTDSQMTAINSDSARELQIQKNEPAISWAKSRLEQLENIRYKKG